MSGTNKKLHGRERKILWLGVLYLPEYKKRSGNLTEKTRRHGKQTHQNTDLKNKSIFWCNSKPSLSDAKNTDVAPRCIGKITLYIDIYIYTYDPLNPWCDFIPTSITLSASLCLEVRWWMLRSARGHRHGKSRKIELFFFFRCLVVCFPPPRPFSRSLDFPPVNF